MAEEEEVPVRLLMYLLLSNLSLLPMLHRPEAVLGEAVVHEEAEEAQLEVNNNFKVAMMHQNHLTLK